MAKILPTIPLRDVVVFPGTIVPLFIGREKSIRAVEEALKRDKFLFLVTQKDPEIENPKRDDLYDIGVVSVIVQNVKLPDGTIKMLIEGIERARILEFKDDQCIECLVEELKESELDKLLEEHLKRVILDELSKFVEKSGKISNETLQAIREIESLSKLIDTITSNMSIRTTEKQKILETIDLVERLKILYGILEREIEITEIDKKIREEVKKQIEKNQKEYYLMEQLRAIQKELGKSELSEIEELREAIEKSGMPKEIKEKALRELRKLELMHPTSAEATVVRNYLDWLTSLPWNKRTKERLDLKKVREVLDKDHYGLEEVKERILEYLAVKKRTKKLKSPILCFVGPPGVGKTSLGESIARAIGRKFTRIALGGVRDEAEIRGHRRTYIGALPGRIIQSIRRVGVKNPVILLDEVDKLSSDYRGDPASALLEVLDPEQNKHFTDHYLAVEFDLSEVFFIATANTTMTIPKPLLDRMEVIEIPGYTENEKLYIARDYLIPKQLKQHGLKRTDIILPDEVILRIIRWYTREAGVRQLERSIAKICRKILKLAEESRVKLPTKVDNNLLEELLGIPKYRDSTILREPAVGTAIGLAWTPTGGDVLLIEVEVVEGKGELILTGQLGDVMKESAKAALTYIRSKRKELNIEKDFHKNYDIHVHIPEGAIPKDGPSAGVTLVTALASSLTGIPVRNDIAMTGEVTLKGRVLAIGGLKEKLLAAKRYGIKNVIIPRENEKDLKEISEDTLKDLNIILVENMDQVLKITLEGIGNRLKDASLPAVYRVSSNDRPTLS
ncbi:MAG: endopeptidase La [Thermosulfidibacteraceae bacterium]|jgi:ATP-dependent Lon protease